MAPDSHPPDGSEPSPERTAAETLVSATLLAFTGGSLDAFLYLQHGKVFAGAMTGNAVLCGIALLGGNGYEAVSHCLPLVAFVCGVLLAETAQDRLKHHAVTTGLACEIAGLLGASFLPRRFPDMLFISCIALLSAYQIASFGKTDRYSYNSTFITGDLRTAIVGVYKALHRETRAEGLTQARELGLIVGCFLTGAVTGAVLAPRTGNHTLWVPSFALCVVFFMALRRSLAQGNSSQIA